VTTLGDAALARHFPAFSLALDFLPAALRAHAFDPAALGRELKCKPYRKHPGLPEYLRTVPLRSTHLV
jgi:hypothetical protein